MNLTSIDLKPDNTRGPGVGAPQQIAIFHQITKSTIYDLLYDLPISKVLKPPVNIIYIFSALELAKVIESARILV